MIWDVTEVFVIERNYQLEDKERTQMQELEKVKLLPLQERKKLQRGKKN